MNNTSQLNAQLQTEKGLAALPWNEKYPTKQDFQGKMFSVLWTIAVNQHNDRRIGIGKSLPDWRRDNWSRNPL